jgi:RNA polymerase sigma factor (sigma-70 family)
MIPDAELLHRYAEESSEAAFTELVQRHLGFVYAAALRQLGGATHRAEEVTQSVFIDLARKSATLSRRTEIVGWLYTSTHYAAAKLKRTEQRRQQREEEAHAMNETPFDHADSSDWDRLRPVLDEAMHALGTDDRTALLLRYFQDRRFAEVGSHLGLTEDAARMRVDRALDKLRALLARRQITSTTAALGLILASQPGVAVPASLLASVTGAALAGAGTVGVGTAAILVFMKTKTAIATLAAVLALGFAV